MRKDHLTECILRSGWEQVGPCVAEGPEVPQGCGRLWRQAGRGRSQKVLLALPSLIILGDVLQKRTREISGRDS